MISCDICLSLSDLTSLSMIISRSIHVAANRIISFFFYLVLYFSSVLKKLFIFNWKIIVLQNFVVFCQTSTWISHQFSSVQSLSHGRLFATPWISARQASLSITNSQSSLKLTFIKSVMPSSHLILCSCLLLLPPNPSQHQSLFQWVSSSHEVAKVLEFQL